MCPVAHAARFFIDLPLVPVKIIQSTCTCMYLGMIYFVIISSVVTTLFISLQQLILLASSLLTKVKCQLPEFFCEEGTMQTVSVF